MLQSPGAIDERNGRPVRIAFTDKDDQHHHADHRDRRGCHVRHRYYHRLHHADDGRHSDDHVELSF